MGVPRFVYSNSHMSKIDDKSGYDQISLSHHSQQYFGMSGKGSGWLELRFLSAGRILPCISN